MNDVVDTSATDKDHWWSRPDTEQSQRIEEALSMHGELGLSAAITYLEHHAIDTGTMLRVLMLPRKRRKLSPAKRAHLRHDDIEPAKPAGSTEPAANP